MTRLHFPEILLTDRLILRRLRYEDAEEIFYTYACKPEATRFVSWPTHKSVDDTRKFLNYAVQAWKDNKDFSYSIRLNQSNRLIGGIGIMNDRGKLQFGYIFSPTQWNLGYATEACRRILKEIHEQSGIEKVSTFVDTENAASIRVLEKCGMIREAMIRELTRFPNQGNVAKDCLIFRMPLK